MRRDKPPDATQDVDCSALTVFCYFLVSGNNLRMRQVSRGCRTHVKAGIPRPAMSAG